MSDLKSGISTAAKTIAKGSSVMIKTASINMKLSGAESALKALYTEIGQMVYTEYLNGKSFNDSFTQKFEQLSLAKEKVSELKQKLDEAKGLVTCKNCKEASKGSSAFCSRCGVSFLDAASLSNPEALPNAAPAKQEVACTICNTSNNISDRFCLSCGRMM